MAQKNCQWNPFWYFLSLQSHSQFSQKDGFFSAVRGKDVWDGTISCVIVFLPPCWITSLTFSIYHHSLILFSWRNRKDDLKDTNNSKRCIALSFIHSSFVYPSRTNQSVRRGFWNNSLKLTGAFPSTKNLSVVPHEPSSKQHSSNESNFSSEHDTLSTSPSEEHIKPSLPSAGFL